MTQRQRLIHPLTGKHYGSVLEMAPSVRKTTVMGVTCISTGQVASRRGECGLSNDGNSLRFPIFRMGCCGEDEWVVDVAEIPVPTVIEKLFFEKVARLIQYTCDCNPEYSVEAFDWDWASFHKNILLPNRMHIQLVMQLSDTIKDRVVYSIHFLRNEWNGDDEEKNDDDVNVRFVKFFSVEDLDFL